MKLNTDLKINILLDYGFKEMTKDYKIDQGIDEDDTLYYKKGYLFNLGHSRRGQFYSLICSLDGMFYVYASKPDGDSGLCRLNHNIFIQLIQEGIVENSFKQ